MKNGAKLFYTLGLVFNILGMVLYTVLFALLLAANGNQEFINQVATETTSSVNLVKEAIVVLIVINAVMLFINIVVCVLTFVARKNLNKGTGKVSPHLVLLLLGIFDVNLFYLLGGIFGMVSASKDNEIEE